MSDLPAKAFAPNEDSKAGFVFALMAYVIWGFLPLFMKALAHVSPAEVISHRVIWSLPVAGAVLIALGRTADLRVAIRSPKMLGMAAMTATLISMNWGLYVWAIGAGYALDTALGYYINPLFSVFLGAVLLGERLKPAQMVAMGLALLAVGLLTWDAGKLPWISLGLTVTWGFYAYLKKSLPLGPNQGFFLEILILTPAALAYIGYLGWSGTGHFMVGVKADTLLLLSCGVVTATPLIFYANGAKKLRLSTIAMMQYIAPTMIFALAIFVFHEPFAPIRMVAFAMIWMALVIYTASMLRGAKA